MRQKLVDARRDLAKTASFAALHFAVAFTVAYLLTGSAAIATGIGLVEPLANTVAFYFHERAWARAEARARPRAAARGTAQALPGQAAAA
ncbi:MAG: DUF2061 domain-containing protein [Steroidobacteraceae bacterium]|jgi:uncharacterized membrane protein|nr:DUF2061 domain-containing protein [Steroidobacteraceae bacterium]